MQKRELYFRKKMRPTRVKQLFSSPKCAFFSPNFCSANSVSSRFYGTQSVPTHSNQSSGNSRCRGACSPVSHRFVHQLGDEMSSCHSRLASIDIGRKCRKRMPANQSLLRQSESLACGQGMRLGWLFSMQPIERTESPQPTSTT